jgi:hypothetical protein
MPTLEQLDLIRLLQLDIDINRFLAIFPFTTLGIYRYRCGDELFLHES